MPEKGKKIPDEIIGGAVAYTTPFPICLKPLFQNEAKHEAIAMMKLIFYSHGNETHHCSQQRFCTQLSYSLNLKVRVFGTRKWRIKLVFTHYHLKSM